MDKEQIHNFFNQYSVEFNKVLNGEIQDAEKTASFFSSCFIASGPAGVHCGENNESFRDAMQKGYAFYRNIGIKSMEIVSRDITLLNDLHAMTRIRWKSGYQRKDGVKSAIEFENIYFTRNINGEHKVFAYITGDEEAALKEIGLI